MAVLEKTFFAHRKPHGMPIILQACHEPIKTKSMEGGGSGLSGYGQAIKALDYGLRHINHPSIRVAPLCDYRTRSILCGNAPILKIKTGDKTFEIAVIEAEEENGSPFIMLGNIHQDDYFGFRSYRSSNTNHLTGGRQGNYLSTVMDEKTLVFNLALVELAKMVRENLRPGEESLIFHGHDHITALATALAGKDGIPTAFTVHNPAFTTTMPLDSVNCLGFGLPAEKYGREVDLLALAMECAGRVAAPSLSYANEISRDDFEHGPKTLTYGTILGRRRRSGEFPGILNSLPPEFIFPAAGQAEKGGNGFRVLFANRLAPQKGYELLEGGLWLAAPALKELDPDFNITVMADGDNESVKQMHNLAVHVNGFHYLPYSEEAMFNHLAAANLALMPSLFEPCGLFAMTAQASGVLALGTRVGGLRDILGEFNHFRDREDFLSKSPALRNLEDALASSYLRLGKYGLFFSKSSPSDSLSPTGFWQGFLGVLRLIKAKDPGLAELRDLAQKHAREHYVPQRMAKEYLERVYLPLLEEKK
ncbi:MAG: glycogen/starch synthase [Candidatus Saganbacteria bacterium]|nr:glycogen/starch synthase [Candidatus Saganbacteria bacterium]